MEGMMLVENHNGIAMTTSVIIANVFGKQHKRVIQDIKEKIGYKVNQHEIVPVTYIDSKGEERPMFLLNRDCTTFLIMGFTGDKATEWKWKYIDAFNKMEQGLKQLNLTNRPKSEENKLLAEIAKAYRSGDIKRLLIATSSYDCYKQKQDEELISQNKYLISQNGKLEQAVISSVDKGEIETSYIRHSNKIKPRKLQILNFIIDYRSENGFSPSLREIGENIGLKSTSTVYNHLASLKKDGYIKSRDIRSRNLIVNNEKYMELI